MIKLQLKFEGEIGQLLNILIGYPTGTIVSVTVNTESDSAESDRSALEKRAWEAALPFVRDGDKIKAIKEWRTITRDSLADAKKNVEVRGFQAGLYVVNENGSYVLADKD